MYYFYLFIIEFCVLTYNYIINSNRIMNQIDTLQSCDNSEMSLSHEKNASFCFAHVGEINVLDVNDCVCVKNDTYSVITQNSINDKFENMTMPPNTFNLNVRECVLSRIEFIGFSLFDKITLQLNGINIASSTYDPEIGSLVISFNKSKNKIIKILQEKYRSDIPNHIDLNDMLPIGCYDDLRVHSKNKLVPSTIQIKYHGYFKYKNWSEAQLEKLIYPYNTHQLRLNGPTHMLEITFNNNVGTIAFFINDDMQFRIKSSTKPIKVYFNDPELISYSVMNENLTDKINKNTLNIEYFVFAQLLIKNSQLDLKLG